jgi:hypothetical protein
MLACIVVGLATALALGSGKGDPFLGILLVAGSTPEVAAVRTNQSMDRLQADGAPVIARTLCTTALKSLVVAALVVGLSDLAFLLTYAFFAEGPPLFPSFEPMARHEQLAPVGLLAGTSIALAVCYLSRRAYWRPGPSRFRLSWGLAPFTIVALLFVGDLAWWRFVYRCSRADWHDVLASVYGGESSVPATAPLGPGERPRPELASYHVRMRRKWERAAARPWLPVAPDPRPPEP